MARVTTYLPDGLDAAVREQLPGLNVSAVLQEALSALLACDHAVLRCTACQAVLTQQAAAQPVLLAFWCELVDAVEPLVDQCATGTGVAAAVWTVARRHGLPAGPVPRPSRSSREAAAGRSWLETRETA